MKYRSLILVYLLFLPFFSHANTENAGFVQGLWYSSQPVFAEVPTRIYIALRNNTGHDLTGTVRFTDNEKRIGSFEVSALEGRLVEAWVDWIPTKGEHVITATVSDAVLHVIGGNTESADITGITASDTLIVDYDTDRDGIGNTEDTDDDNDSVSDTEETERGSNPLVSNPKSVSEETESSKDSESPNTEVLTADTRTETKKSTPSRGGLEQYIENEKVDTLFGSVTEKIENAKTALDTYRERRDTTLAENTSPTELEHPTEMKLGTLTENATITRTQIDTEKGFLKSFVAGVAALLSSLWTLVLFSTSKILNYPAILEVLLLLGILVFFYRVARRLGRRNRY
ncbi:hypothetical protein IPH92_03695 [Candidatus Kaiserbacteria bacterium]|nr:MAG: hypothetical protein IPH92_03695 [Candidatus Kaiserbacteria bacterium]